MYQDYRFIYNLSSICLFICVGVSSSLSPDFLRRNFEAEREAM